MRSKKSAPASLDKRIKYTPELIWGIHPVLEHLQRQPEHISEVILQKNKRGTTWQELIDCAKKNSIKCRFVERITVTGSPEGPVNHQGVVARRSNIGLTPFASFLDQLTSQVEAGEHPRLLACDSIQDPHNLGALIRSACGAGVTHILLTRERSAPLSGTVAKAAAGTMGQITLCQAANLSAALQDLKSAGFWIFGAVKDKQARSLYDTEFDMPLCLVIGNEGRGIRPLVQRQCDVLLTIPLAGEVESLNSSVAGAVILFEMFRQKHTTDAL